jgi:signal transduction histidine kinase
MLQELLIDHKDEILALTRRNTLQRPGVHPQSGKLAEGLPLFYKALVEVFRNAEAPGETQLTGGHGRELFNLGYTVVQVVNAYGALCQAVTETAEKLHADISAREFSLLNATLDRAIAEAVAEFELAQTQVATLKDAQRLGTLVNQLRTCLETVLVAHESIKKGLVSVAGSTNSLMERNLVRMADILDGAVTGIRVRSEPQPVIRPVRLIDAVSEVEIVSAAEGRMRDVSLSIHVDPKLTVLVDRNHIVSTLANLLQNAVKFSRSGGIVVIRSVERRDTASIDIEDQCGGLPKGRVEDLFQPFSQKSADRTGVGLGLPLSRRAMEMNKGSLTAVDLPGKGCIFTVTLPRARAVQPPERSARSLPARRASRRTGRRRAQAPSAGRMGRPKRSARPPARP